MQVDIPTQKFNLYYYMTSLCMYFWFLFNFFANDVAYDNCRRNMCS